MIIIKSSLFAGIVDGCPDALGRWGDSIIYYLCCRVGRGLLSVMIFEVQDKPEPCDLVGDLGYGLLPLSRLKNQLPPILPALPKLGCVRFAPCGSHGHEWS
jgi:hypothetical protein